MDPRKKDHTESKSSENLSSGTSSPTDSRSRAGSASRGSILSRSLSSISGVISPYKRNSSTSTSSSSLNSSSPTSPKSPKKSPKRKTSTHQDFQKKYSVERILEASKHKLDNLPSVPDDLKTICKSLFYAVSTLPPGSYHIFYDTQSRNFGVDIEGVTQNKIKLEDTTSVNFLLVIGDAKTSLYWLNKNHVFGVGGFGTVIAGHEVATKMGQKDFKYVSPSRENISAVKICEYNIKSNNKNNKTKQIEDIKDLEKINIKEAILASKNMELTEENSSNVTKNIQGLKECELLIAEGKTGQRKNNLIRSGQLILVMKYIDGPSLVDVILSMDGDDLRGKRYLRPEFKIHLFEQLIKTMHDFHTLSQGKKIIEDGKIVSGRIHGDIKAENIIFNPFSHELVLIDLDDSVKKTEQLFLNGTFGYTPEEVWSDKNHSYDQRADCFALGVVLAGLISSKCFPKVYIELQRARDQKAGGKHNTFNDLRHSLPDIYTQPNILIAATLPPFGSEQTSLFIITPNGLYANNKRDGYECVIEAKKLKEMGLERLINIALKLKNTYEAVKLNNDDLENICKNIKVVCERYQKKIEFTVTEKDIFYIAPALPDKPVKNFAHFLCIPTGLYRFNGETYEVIVDKKDALPCNIVSSLTKDANKVAPLLYPNQIKLTLNETMILNNVQSAEPVRYKSLSEFYSENNIAWDRRTCEQLFADISVQLSDVVAEDLNQLKASPEDVINEYVYQYYIFPKLRSFVRIYTSENEKDRPDDMMVASILSEIEAIKIQYRQQVDIHQKKYAGNYEHPSNDSAPSSPTPKRKKLSLGRPKSMAFGKPTHTSKVAPSNLGLFPPMDSIQERSKEDDLNNKSTDIQSPHNRETTVLNPKFSSSSSD